MGRNFTRGIKAGSSRTGARIWDFLTPGPVLNCYLETIRNYLRKSNLLIRPTDKTTPPLKFIIELEKIRPKTS